MKRTITFFLSAILMVSFFNFNTFATSDESFIPYITDFSLTSNTDTHITNENNRASGLILSYSIHLTKTGTKLNITGLTFCSVDVVKCGFKDLMVQRRQTSSDSWKNYFDIGDVYADTAGANLDMTVSVAAGYQYRVTCKHYAKKNLLSVQTISNISNIVTTV